MAEAALRDDAGTPEERAHTMEKAAVLMGKAARIAEKTGEVINNGQNYRGEVKDGEAHGLGVNRWSGAWMIPSSYKDGSVMYEGEYRNGSLHGLTLLRWPNGTISYAGQTQDGNGYHGLGVSRLEDGSVNYAGWWHRNQWGVHK
eukprot:GHVU01125226.1.p1 GENE.GHVU01125226.1~~GHVU01125226.1.p1  ORF type:complete len:167 (+),score=32.60 GHVU01125226.1:71-502(+)